MTEENRWEPATAGPSPILDDAFRSEPPVPAATHAQGAPHAEFPIRRYRSIWISDVHLGTRGCQAALLLDFLEHTDSALLYLVGDIIDAWQLRKNWYWPERHNEVLRLVLRKARQGTRVVYIPGNHDEFFRDYVQLSLGGVTLVQDAVHVPADERRFLVIHGDAFDAVVTTARWLAHLGDAAYQLALRVNTVFNYARRRLGYPYWSLAAYLKHKVKNTVSFLSRFEHAVVEAARRQRLDGVICGHIHHAELREIDGVLYANDGDWVESCSALVEHDSGELELVRWAEVRGVDFHEANG
jgi:UDP-2,3-diacylglucosamine pyrophosphatase LpxH